jgi:phosphohistidine phosphatase
MRHGEAVSRAGGQQDHERALSVRGRLDAEFIGGSPKDGACEPQLVLCSSARRAIETLAAIRQFVPATAAERIERDLYLASAEALLERVRAVEDEYASILLIGHNPGIGRLAYELSHPVETPEFDRLSRSFPTAALVTLRFDTDRWAEIGPGRAHLESFMVSISLSDLR